MKHVVIQNGNIIGASSNPCVAQGIHSVGISEEAFQKYEAGMNIRINEDGFVELYEGERAVQAQIDGLLTMYKDIVEQKEISDRKVQNFSEMLLTEKAEKAQRESDDLRAKLVGMYGQAVNAYGEEKVDAILFGNQENKN